MAMFPRSIVFGMPASDQIQNPDQFHQFQYFKKTRVSKTDAQTTSGIHSSPITYLNDDCLLHILSFIVSARDLLNAEGVCRRWQKLCPESWKTFHSFDVTSEQLEYDTNFNYTDEEWINVPMCKQVFSRCWNYLTRINISRLSNCQTKTLMNLDEFCEQLSPTDKKGRKSKPNEKVHKNEMLYLDQLVECENVEELWLCCCAIEVNDELLEQIFQKNKRLRLLYLSKYKFNGKCFSALPLGAMESLLIINCVIEDPGHLNTVIHSAPKMHTFCASDVKVSQFNRIRISSPHLTRLNLEGTCRVDLTPDIRESKNLTVLSLAFTDLDDEILKIIIQNCRQLIILNLSWNRNLTDISLDNLNSLSRLEYLSIGENEEFTDAGLLGLWQNIQILDVSGTKFSEAALTTIIQRWQTLRGLNITECKQLTNSFVESVMSIVQNRPNKIPLEIAISGKSINQSKLKKKCSVVKLTRSHRLDNLCNSIFMKHCQPNIENHISVES